jgi:hypothetical protein
MKNRQKQVMRIRTSCLPITRLGFPPFARLIEDAQDVAFFERELIGIACGGSVLTQISVESSAQR